MQKTSWQKDTKLDLKTDVACSTCKRSTKHKILTNIYLTGEYGQEQYGEFYAFVDWIDDYQIIECQGCESISFRKIYSDSENTEPIGPDEYIQVESEDIFPNPEGRDVIEDNHLLPADLKRIYEETLNALNSDQPVLSGIGVRAIIETVCKEKGTTGRTLYDKINDLVTQGVLTNDGASILHKLRTLGNDAAHEVKPHTQSQLGLAFDVIDHLLKGVYILPHHASAKFD